jgi:glyoxylase-like metal-dependent hydrolase (beta-lactamase superfamily II)
MAAGLADMTNQQSYEIFAVHYGHHDRQSSANYIGGDTHDILQPLDYYVWAIIGANRTYILDTGFDAKMGKKRQRTLVRPIADGLKAIGVAPDRVEDVIVSHLHFDHAGNPDLFPSAKYHLQDTEMAYATGRCMCHSFLKTPFEEEDVVAMVRKLFTGRVVFHDGADQIAPGLTVHKIGGHSKGLQCVRVNTRRGYVVLASDATHLYKHFEEGRVFPTTYNPAEVLEGYDTLRKLATSKDHIIPGHDPEVLKRYPAANPGLEGWVVRLDADPLG